MGTQGRAAGAAAGRPLGAPTGGRGLHASTGWLAAAGGSLVGTALQLSQARLWPLPTYAALAAVAMVLAWLSGRRGVLRASAIALALAAGATGAGALTGLRAVHYLDDALPPALEGRDLILTGVVAQMPQRSTRGLRFQLAVEQAQWAAPPAADAGEPHVAPPAVPPRVALSWYDAGGMPWGATASVPATGRPPEVERPELHAGERWRLTVRLKAPHGNRNPHAFDYELWLWEQGVQAIGYVRTGPRHAAPRRLGTTRHYPVEQAREAVRDAILARAAPTRDPGFARSARVVAALVTGDQAAIERSDWEMFRATGVAHLMSISGLHITMCASFVASSLLVRSAAP